ncbi:membrane protein [Croceicoccus mobilis]|uniref:Membrane protein n=2 Tax=Croceicoccus mobilis TaxID=1703339 RepID=A0A917DR89_9SPHN|nr:membrane protein [Croceicoccus mobilis]
MTFAVLAMLSWSESAFAHLTPNSEVTLHLSGDRVEAQIIVPAAEYAYASSHRAGNGETDLADARKYLARRITLTTADGATLPMRIDQLRFAQVAGPLDLLATAYFPLPAGKSAGPFSLRWSVVVDSVPDHFALISLADGGESRVIGAVRQTDQNITFTPDPSMFTSFVRAAWLGAIHVATGFDHLLFLMALLLAAPLAARDKRWSRVRGLRESLYHMGGIVTGFTVGHSVTLVAAGLGNWHLQTGPVEALIALSVVVTACHAIRPIFPGREAWVATGFGLVHGLAFATLVAEADTNIAHNLPTLVGFNIGIELLQLAVLACVVPPLLWLARRAQFAPMRVAGGAIVALCGCWWLYQRLPAVIA